jgi:hypothetical protein
MSDHDFNRPFLDLNSMDLFTGIQAPLQRAWNEEQHEAASKQLHSHYGGLSGGEESGDPAAIRDLDAEFSVRGVVREEKELGAKLVSHELFELSSGRSRGKNVSCAAGTAL